VSRRPLVSGLLVVMTVCVLALVGCQSGSTAIGSTTKDAATSVPTSAASPSSSPSPTGVSSGPAASFPLTGEPAPEATRAARPIVAVAVAGGSGAAPPTGLQSADVVYAAYPGAGTVRYVALYQSAIPPRVGPVGPAAPDDIRLLNVMHPLFGFADGPQRFVKPLSHSSIVGLPRSAHPTAYSGTPPGLYTSPAALSALAPPRSVVPPVLLSYSRPLARSGVRQAHALTITVPGRVQVAWRFDSRSRTWTQTGSGGPTATNIIVATMPYRTVLDRNHGKPVRSPVVVGDGRCIGLALDQVAHCRWTKPGRDKLTNYTDDGGVPLGLAPGKTLIAMVPPGSTVKTR
jgi:hypothetical protein